jgi:hypothetical protein
VAGKGGDTLRIAIGKAGNFDTIDMSALPVTCSTITLTAGEIAIPQAYLTINGPADRTVTVSGNNVGRVLYHSGTGQLVLNGFEVAYGHSVGIGGCIWTKGRLYMSGMIASHCTGAAGGAVFANGNVQASHATIYANNSVNGCGGIRTDANAADVRQPGDRQQRGTSTVADCARTGRRAWSGRQSPTIMPRKAAVVELPGAA